VLAARDAGVRERREHGAHHARGDPKNPAGQDLDRAPNADDQHGLNTMELRLLAWTVAFGLAQVFIAAGFATWQRGLQWNVSNRDGAPPALAGAAARAVRANANFLETFPFFAAAVLGVVLAGKTGEHTLLGAQLYLGARVAYLPIYIVGIPYLRTLVYGVSIWGLLQLLEALF